MAGDETQYTASYGWNWQSAVAIAKSLGSLVLPTPSWMRALTVRCLLTRTALHADAEGISTCYGPYQWSDITDIVLWEYNYLKIIGIARRRDYVAADEATAAATTVRTPGQSRRSRYRARAQLGPRSAVSRYPALMAPDGTPTGPEHVVTTNGWCVDTNLLVTAAQRFAPHVRVADLVGTLLVPRLPPFALPVEYPFDRPERIRWRKILWALGALLSASLLIFAGSHLGPALRAARGAGTSGTWVAEQCEGRPGSCTWYGKFELPDGAVTHSHVQYAGTVTPVYPGRAIPALDSGAGNEVYPVTGTDRWIHDVLGMAAGALVLLLLIWRFVHVRRLRWRSRHPANWLIPDHDGS